MTQTHRDVTLATVGKWTKAERIDFLLEHWQDFHETLHAVADGREVSVDDDAVPGMPAIYHHPSVAELRRAIDATKAAMPVQAAHLLAFYEGEWRIATKNRTRKAKKTGKLEIVHERKRERIVPAGVKRTKVKAAFDRVCVEFRGEVHIPSEFLKPIPTLQAA